MNLLKGDCAGRVQRATAESRQSLSRQVTRQVALSTGAAVIDTWEFFCADGYCETDSGEELLYRDSRGHITVDASRLLTPLFVDNLGR